MRLIKLFSLSLLVSFLSASDNSSLLSVLKQEKLNIDKQKIELESDNLKFDWVEKVMGAYTLNNNDEKEV